MPRLTLTCLVSAALLASAASATAQPAAAALTPPAERIGDGAIQHDHRAYESLQARIRALNERGRRLDDRHLAKAQCWLDTSFHEYTRNDRSAFPQTALDRSAALVSAMEQGATPPVESAEPVDGAPRLRPDLWQRLQVLPGRGGQACSAARAACAEVTLLHAEHEHAQQGWRHARPYVQQAEEAVADAEQLASGCATR